MNAKISPVFGMIALALSAKAHAHFPTLMCHVDKQNDENLVCVAGYSDASHAADETLNVFTYEDELITKVVTSSDGSVTLQRPKREFYIVFDPGHESPAEFDYAELE